MPPYINSLVLLDYQEEETMGVTVEKQIETATSATAKHNAVSSSFSVLRQGDVFLEMEEDEDPAASDADLVEVDLNQSLASLTIKSPSSSIQKKVSFTELHIREHQVILGDHPCCTVGLPVTLGWEVQQESSVSLDDYEATRCRRRSRHEMRLSFEERRLILSDYSEEDVRRVQRKLHRERRCSGRAKRQFFSQQDAVTSE